MVGHAATELLVGARRRPIRTSHPEMRGHANNTIEAGWSCRQGLDAKKNQTFLRRENCFLLDIPFYRTRLLQKTQSVTPG